MYFHVYFSRASWEVLVYVTRLSCTLLCRISPLSVLEFSIRSYYMHIWPTPVVGQWLVTIGHCCLCCNVMFQQTSSNESIFVNYHTKIRWIRINLSLSIYLQCWTCSQEVILDLYVMYASFVIVILRSCNVTMAWVNQAPLKYMDSCNNHQTKSG